MILKNSEDFIKQYPYLEGLFLSAQEHEAGKFLMREYAKHVIDYLGYVSELYKIHEVKGFVKDIKNDIESLELEYQHKLMEEYKKKINDEF